MPLCPQSLYPDTSLVLPHGPPSELPLQFICSTSRARLNLNLSMKSTALLTAVTTVFFSCLLILSGHPSPLLPGTPTSQNLLQCLKTQFFVAPGPSHMPANTLVGTRLPPAPTLNYSSSFRYHQGMKGATLECISLLHSPSAHHSLHL